MTYCKVLKIVKVVYMTAHYLRGKKWKCTNVRFQFYMWNGTIYLKVDCDKLKLYTINHKGITKIIQKEIAKWNNESF
jgi:hypothetical protein